MMMMMKSMLNTDFNMLQSIYLQFDRYCQIINEFNPGTILLIDRRFASLLCRLLRCCPNWVLVSRPWGEKD
jgi:hypothetical protein